MIKEEERPPFPALVSNEELNWRAFLNRLQDPKIKPEFIYDSELDILDCYFWFGEGTRQKTMSIVHYLDQWVALLISEENEILGFHLEYYHTFFYSKTQIWKLSELANFDLKKSTKGLDLWLMATTENQINWQVKNLAEKPS